MDREAFVSRQRAIRAEAALMTRSTMALRADDAALRRDLEAMRAAAAARQARAPRRSRDQSPMETGTPAAPV
jgi:hypothetical protein